MPTSIDLVATDLDGTFWGNDGRCDARTLAAVDTLARRGVPVLIATGRRRRSAATGLAVNDIELPAVLLNGCHGWDYARGEQFHLSPFDPDGAHAVVDLCAAADVSPVIYVDGDDPDCFATPHCSSAAGHLAALAPHVAPTPDLHSIIEQHAVIGFAVLGLIGAEVHSLAEAVNSVEAGTATTSVDHQYGDWSVMIQPHGVTKWNGIESFCRHRGLDPDRVLAVGDAGNDLGMLQAASVAVAIATAPDDVRAVADHLIAPPDQGGWAGLLDLI